MGDIASGMFALGGAGVGGLAGYAAKAVEIRGQHKAAEAARATALAETRRSVYTAFVERADVAADAARYVWSYARRTDVPDGVRVHYLAAWDALVQARAAVDVVGPRPAAEAAVDLVRSVARIGNRVDEWLDGSPWTDADETEYEKDRETVRTCRESFLRVVRDVLGTG